MTCRLPLYAAVALAVAAAPEWAIGQTPHPATAQFETAPAVNASAFAGFQGWTPEVGGPGWREANDTMGSLGGHVGHVQRQTAAPAPQPPTATPVWPPPAPAGPVPHRSGEHHSPGGAK